MLQGRHHRCCKPVMMLQGRCRVVPKANHQSTTSRSTTLSGRQHRCCKSGTMLHGGCRMLQRLAATLRSGTLQGWHTIAAASQARCCITDAKLLQWVSPDQQLPQPRRHALDQHYHNRVVAMVLIHNSTRKACIAC